MMSFTVIPEIEAFLFHKFDHFRVVCPSDMCPSDIQTIPGNIHIQLLADGKLAMKRDTIFMTNITK